MPLEFVGDAIKLSGLTGTKLKCDVIGEYYPFWWSITSGGKSRNYQYPTAIVELNAATGEVYVKDIQQIVLGSSGHSLDLKVKNHPNTKNLKIILIEENADCYAHLKKVIGRKWPTISIKDAVGPINQNTANIYLLRMTLDDALNTIENISLGNTLYFFDPLLSVEYEAVEKVASKRMRTFHKTGTEFIIFLFTSDWFLGRKMEDKQFAPLPNTPEEKSWTDDEKRTVIEADTLFGNKEWRGSVLNNNPAEEKEKILVELYKNRLHKWFRYVLPLPFNPKDNQIFHLILCSNFETGVRMTKDHYSKLTANPKYAPDNANAFAKFKHWHPELFKNLKSVVRPLQWHILWMTISQHEGGICDCMCRDFAKNNIGNNILERQELLEWLEGRQYVVRFNIENPWNIPIKQYKINWPYIKQKLDVEPPPQLKPLSPEMIIK